MGRIGSDAGSEERSHVRSEHRPIGPPPVARSHHRSPPVDRDQVCRSTLGVSNTNPSSTEGDSRGTPDTYVGIDLHRRRSVIVRRSETGETLDKVRIDNDPVALAAEVTKAGPHPDVVLEATYGWHWAADLPQRVRWPASTSPIRSATTGGIAGSRTTSATPRTWSTLLRMGRLAEAWIAPPPVARAA